MKFFFNLVFVLILAKPVLSEVFETKYLIKNRGITIGLLTWKLDITEDNYTTVLTLEHKGFLSSLFPFNGKYRSVGKINNNHLFPNEYSQFWKTKNKERLVKITYENKKIKSLVLSPVENEAPRIKYKLLENYSDPLSSFLNILFNGEPSFTLDGRRSYKLSPTLKNKSIKILIKQYTNIWADHKRKDIEFIEIFTNKNSRLPEKINIMFGGTTFLLTKI